MTAYSRGTLNAANDTIASPTQTETYTLDTLGNWGSVTTNGTTQARTHDAQNKVTTAGGATPRV